MFAPPMATIRVFFVKVLELEKFGGTMANQLVNFQE
jgi:hypothetical protein